MNVRLVFALCSTPIIHCARPSTAQRPPCTASPCTVVADFDSNSVVASSDAAKAALILEGGSSRPGTSGGAGGATNATGGAGAPSSGASVTASAVAWFDTDSEDVIQVPRRAPCYGSCSRSMRVDAQEYIKAFEEKN